MFFFRLSRLLPLVLALPFMCAALSSSPARAEDPIRLRYANFPAAATFPCVQMEKWADEVENRTGGKVAIETFPGGTLLDARSILRGVARGQADIGCVSLSYHPGSFPFFDVFGLPLGFSSARDAGEAAFIMYLKHQPRELAPYKVLLMFACAPSQIMSTQAVASLEDLKSLPLRASGSLSDVIEALGGQALSMPMSETPEALQKGMVKGVFSSWDTLKDLNYAENCRYGLEIDSSVYPFVVVMNKKAWDRLPDDVKAVFDGYAMEHCRFTGDYVDDWGRQALKWAEETYDFRLVKLSDAEKARAAEQCAPLLDAWKKKVAAELGMDGDAVLNEIFALRDQLKAARSEH